MGFKRLFGLSFSRLLPGETLILQTHCNKSAKRCQIKKKGGSYEIQLDRSYNHSCDSARLSVGYAGFKF